jgi:CheY-like chemotaxis protein
MRASLPSTISISEYVNSSFYIKADSGQIYQILLNLCANAGHAMREKGGLLEVSLSDMELTSEDIRFYPDLRPGLYLKLSVKDTGYGMEKSVAERIFEPFFTTKKRGEGTGMGLSVVHGIVKGHGGTINVYSEPEKGSVFHILFPVTDNKETVKKEFYENLSSGKSRILFIDDEKNMVKLMNDVLAKLGYSVTALTSAVEALEIFKNSPGEFDLIITDQSMPDITGLALAEKILKIRPEIPVILCTGFMEVPLPGKCEKIGIKEILEKPVSIRKIGETIKKVITHI